MAVLRITTDQQLRVTTDNEIRSTNVQFSKLKSIVITPVLSKPDITQRHIFESQDLNLNPILEKPNVIQEHAFQANSITNPTPILGVSGFFINRTFLVQVFEDEQNIKPKGIEYFMKKPSEFGQEQNYSDWPNFGSRESYVHNFYEYTTLLEEFENIFTLPDFSSQVKTKKMINYISGFYLDTFEKIFDPSEPTSVYSQIKDVFEQLYPTPQETWEPRKWWGDEEIKLQISNLLSNGELFNRIRFDNFGIGFDERLMEVYNNLPKNLIFGEQGFRFDTQGFPIFDRDLMFPVVTKSLVNFVTDTGFKETETKDAMEMFFDFTFETFKGAIKFMESEFYTLEDTKQYNGTEFKVDEFERPNTFFNKAKQNLYARGMNFLDEEQIINTENLENPDILPETAKIRNSGVFLGGATQKEFYQEYLDIGFYRYVTEIFKRFMRDQYYTIQEFVFDPIFNYYDEYFKLQQELIIDQFDLLFEEQLENVEDSLLKKIELSYNFDYSIEGQNNYFTKGSLELPMKKNFFVIDKTIDLKVEDFSEDTQLNGQYITIFNSIGEEHYFWFNVNNEAADPEISSFGYEIEWSFSDQSSLYEKMKEKIEESIFLTVDIESESIVISSNDEEIQISSIQVVGENINAETEYEIRHTSKFFSSVGKNKYFLDFIDIRKKSFYGNIL